MLARAADILPFSERVSVLFGDEAVNAFLTPHPRGSLGLRLLYVARGGGPRQSVLDVRGLCGWEACLQV